MATEPPMVKICGITSVADGAAAISLGAWAIGLVFAEESPRAVGLEAAAEIAGALSPLTSKVGVFVDPDPDQARAAVESCGLTMVQAHACADVAALREAVGVPVTEAVKIEGEDDVVRAKESAADLVLLDASVPGKEGGTGMTFDWALLEQDPLGRPFALAGGLTPDNVADAVARLSPIMVDVSSGVEAAPGVKDPTLIQSFMQGVALGFERAS